MPASIRDTDSKVVRSFDPLLPPLYGKIRVGTTPSRAPVIAPLVGVFVVFDAHPLLPTCGRPAPVSSWCVSWCCCWGGRLRGLTGGLGRLPGASTSLWEGVVLPG